jgi:hypothetical protein
VAAPPPDADGDRRRLPTPPRHQIKPTGAERLLPARASMRLGATVQLPKKGEKHRLVGRTG